MYAHLDKVKAIVWLMCVDFSSAFNTIQCHMLAWQVTWNEDQRTSVLWIIDYLTNRPQFVRIGADVKSATRCTNTYAHQGTVLSPFLFCLYIESRRSQNENTPIVEFADDTGLTGHVTDDDDSYYRRQIRDSVDWCDENYLQLHEKKKKGEKKRKLLLILEGINVEKK